MIFAANVMVKIECPVVNAIGHYLDPIKKIVSRVDVESLRQAELKRAEEFHIPPERQNRISVHCRFRRQVGHCGAPCAQSLIR
jgi:hypothetical protein